MLTFEISLPEASFVCIYRAIFFLTGRWLNQNLKTPGITTIDWPFMPVYG
jgi:hypothetical protein